MTELLVVDRGPVRTGHRLASRDRQDGVNAVVQERVSRSASR
jgi:hypothetical protein